WPGGHRVFRPVSGPAAGSRRAEPAATGPAQAGPARTEPFRAGHDHGAEPGRAPGGDRAGPADPGRGPLLGRPGSWLGRRAQAEAVRSPAAGAVPAVVR